MASAATQELEGLKVSEKKPKIMGRVVLALGDITHHNINQLKEINQSVFPVSYNEKFYTDIVNAGELAKFAYFNDIVVGAVCCRYDKFEDAKSLYIMTLGTLAPYRGFGVGTMLLNHIFDICKKDPVIENVFLHVQINNETALDFYKKNGFEVREMVEKYYKRIEPDSAYLVVKKLK